MLQVTADVFSGRSNPTWVVTNEREVRAVLREVTRDRALVAEAAPPEAGLGFRGLIVESLSDELATNLDLQGSLYLPIGAYAADGRANELAERLVSLIGQAEPTVAAEPDALPLDQSLQDFLLDQITTSARQSVLDEPSLVIPAEAEAELDVEEESFVAATCGIELAQYNPGFWNNNTTIRYNNNCYNYASNKRTNTFAQPGRGAGSMYRAITCPEVTRAALADGLRRRFNCFPAAEAPRYLVALVVAPGPGFVDYHWYRKVREGFWGHKPGGTAARNLDNRGRIIEDPATCDRGPYTQFCGYFYTCRSQRIR